MTRDMGESSLSGDMIRMPFPDGGYALYPMKFASDAINLRKYSLFVAKGTTEQDASILMATTNTGARAILIGTYDKLVEQLLDIQWESNETKTSEGLMFRKIAPSLQSLEKLISLLINTSKQ